MLYLANIFAYALSKEKMQYIHILIIIYMPHVLVCFILIRYSCSDRFYRYSSGFLKHWHSQSCTSTTLRWTLTHRQLEIHGCVLSPIATDALVLVLMHQAISNQCWPNSHFIGKRLENKHQWNLNHNTKLFIHENAFENIICEIAAILSRERWVNYKATKHNKTLYISHGMYFIFEILCWWSNFFSWLLMNDHCQSILCYH